MNESSKPEDFLKKIKREEERKKEGKLTIFLGMAAGVGKTYAMLEKAHEKIREGRNVVIGCIYTHDRAETEKLVEGIPRIPEKWVRYRNVVFKELDIDQILAVKPEIVLIDELAHSNVEGSRHPKRWQDVIEVLEAGIDVYTTLNVQHIESRKDIVESITEIAIRETVPDQIIEKAYQIELVDLSPYDLLKRLQEGKVYLGDQSRFALENFFKEEKLTALREISLRLTAEKVDIDLKQMTLGQEKSSAWRLNEKFMTLLDDTVDCEQIIRETKKTSFSQASPWIALYFEQGDEGNESSRNQLKKNQDLARSLGAEVISTSDYNHVLAIQRVVKNKQITHLILATNLKPALFNQLRQYFFLFRLKKACPYLNITFFASKIEKKPFFSSKWLSKNATFASYLGAILWVAALTGICLILIQYLSYSAISLIYLWGVLFLGLYASPGPILLAVLLIFLILNALFMPTLDLLYSTVYIDYAIFYMLTAILIGILTYRMRTREVELYTQEERTQAINQILKEIVFSTTRLDLSLNVAKIISSALKGQTEIIFKDESGELKALKGKTMITDEKEKAVATWCLKNGKVAGWSTDTLSSVPTLYIPIKGRSEIWGVIGFRPHRDENLTPSEMNFLYTIAEQIGVHDERSYLEEQAKKMDYFRQLENIHQAIISSVSEEFKAPLKEMHDATDEIEKNLPKSLPAVHQLKESNEKLSRLVDNILNMSRISSGFLTIHKEASSIPQLLNTVFENLKKPLETHRIHFNFPKRLPYVSLDANLMEIAITNLLFHAIDHSPPNSALEISAARTDHHITLSIHDLGLAPLSQDNLNALPTLQTWASGIELAIVKAIVEIHEGKITAKNHPKGGVVFEINLPL